MLSAQDYYPFGSTLPGRTFQDGRFDGFRFAFNGQEKDNEIAGVGNIMTAEFWEYDARLGRRWNVDPKPKFHESPYSCFSNNPIWIIDPLGDDTFKVFIPQKTWKNVYRTHILGMQKNPQLVQNNRIYLKYDSDLTNNRKRRYEAKQNSGLTSMPDEDIDEFPYACTMEGGKNAACQRIPRRENRQHGAYIGWVVKWNKMKTGDFFEVNLIPDDREGEKERITVREPIPVVGPSRVPYLLIIDAIERLDELNKSLKVPDYIKNKRPILLPMPMPMPIPAPL